ncbi:hypothetical protein D478_02957, partial [Brevibacillus agri BAB-2500]
QLYYWYRLWQERKQSHQKKRYKTLLKKGPGKFCPYAHFAFWLYLVKVEFPTLRIINFIFLTKT